MCKEYQEEYRDAYVRGAKGRRSPVLGPEDVESVDQTQEDEIDHCELRPTKLVPP